MPFFCLADRRWIERRGLSEPMTGGGICGTFTWENENLIKKN